MQAVPAADGSARARPLYPGSPEIAVTWSPTADGWRLRSAIPFALISFASLTLPASLGALLNAFLDARVWAMKQEPEHEDTSRVDTAQRVFLKNGNLDLKTPLRWKVYGESFEIK